jgi:hypothetical protein
VAAEETKPVWTTSSFLLYAGAATVLGAAGGALAYLSVQYGEAAFVGWAALVLVVLYGIADGFRRRDRWLAAGVFAFASVIAWVAFVAALWTWFGWLSSGATSSSPFHGFSVGRLSLELLVLVAAWSDRRRFRFPFIALISTVVGWLFVTDLVSDGGTWSVVVTLFVGLAYFAAGSARSEPSAFWLHVAAGVLIGGSLLYWWHSSDWQWALVSVAALVYVGIAERTGRSSWAVLAAIGLLAAATHFTVDWTRTSLPVVGGSGASAAPRLWVPSLVFAFAGFLLVALGLRAARRGGGPRV